jgi:rhomboid domain-containing protein 1
MSHFGARFSRMSNNPNNFPQGPSNANIRDLRPVGQTRFQELLGQYPLVSFAITVVCILVYIASNLTNFGKAVSTFAIQPYAVILDLELYRIITCAYMHLSIMHIGMNMFSLFSIGTSLEAIFGSLRFFFLILVYTIVIGIVYLGLAVIEIFVWSPAGFYGSAAGFSGVLFAMAVDESALSVAPTRSVFGFFSVPTKLYPWVLMLVLSIIIPGVSLLGHLAGIIVGGMHTSGYLSWLLPSLSTLRKLEDQPWMRPLVRLEMYRLVPTSDLVLERNSSASISLFSQVRQILGTLLSPITQRFSSNSSTTSSTVSSTSVSTPRFSGTGTVASGATATPAPISPQPSQSNSSSEVESGLAAPARPSWASSVSGAISGSSGAHKYSRLGVNESSSDENQSIQIQDVVVSTDSREAIRQKAAAAAEARAATAKSVGVPQQQQQQQQQQQPRI